MVCGRRVSREVLETNTKYAEIDRNQKETFLSNFEFSFRKAQLSERKEKEWLQKQYDYTFT